MSLLLLLRRAVSVSSSILITRPNLGPLGSRSIHASRPLRGLEEFFENGQALPLFDQNNRKTYGRAWSTNELRIKSFDDLHCLWWTLIKEVNMLSTQQAEAKRMGQRWFGMPRLQKCRLSMARLKTILTERVSLHQKATELVKAKPVEEGQFILQMQKEDKLKQLWRKRTFRRRLNYRTRRPALFT